MIIHIKIRKFALLYNILKMEEGGNIFYYSKESYLVEDDYFSERNLNMLMLGDSIVKDKNSNTINVYRKVKHTYRLIFSLEYKGRK